MSHSKLAEKLRQNLDQCLKCEADDSSRRFLSKEDLDSFWDNASDDIETLLKRRLPTIDQRDHFKADFSRITCVLFWIRFREAPYPDLFDRLQSADTYQQVRDKDLPLSLDQCVTCFGESHAQRFYQDQYHFLEPIHIDPDLTQFERYHWWHRFPYVGRPKIVGTGAFGEVSEAKILRNYYGKHGDSNDEDKLVAVKSFRHERDSAVESQNNSYLKGNLSKHRNVLVHHAAILHDDTFYIFMALAPYGDLETLLSGGSRRDNLPTNDQHYDVLKAFPGTTRRNVLQEFRNLTAALRFLHHDVKNDDGESLRLAHNDLRPQNVLIFEERDQPIGRWKITDFGISTLKSKSPERRYNGQQVIGDFLHNPSEQARERSMEGPHRAPEVSSTIYDRDRKADIWSLGCVFTEVIAFMQGFHQSNDRWSKSDSKVETLRKIYGRSFYHTIKEEKASFSLKPEVREWLTTVSLIDDHYNECVGIACLMLRPDREARMDAGVVENKLNRVIRHMQDGKSYSKPFKLEKEVRTLEKWCPPSLQRHTISLSDLTSVPPKARHDLLKDDLFMLTFTESALLLVSKSPIRRKRILSIRAIETSINQKLIGRSFQLPSQIQWRNLELNGSYGCVTGVRRSLMRSLEYRHFDLESGQALSTDEALVQDAVLKQAVPARTGVIAFCYDSVIKLRAYSYDLDVPLSSPKEGTFRTVVFSDSGDKLFARVSFHKKPRQDVLKVWDITLPQRPNLLASFKVERPSQKVNRDDFYTILPWKNEIGGTMIYRNGGRGIMFTIWATAQDQANLHACHQGETNHCPAVATTASAITMEYLVIVDVRHDMWLYKLDFTSNRGTLALQPLGSHKMPVEKASWHVLRRSMTSTDTIGVQLVVHKKGHADPYYYDVRIRSGNRQGWDLVKSVKAG